MGEHCERKERELVRERVQQTLERDLSSLPGARRRDEPIPAAGLSEHVRGQLRAFQAAGLLSREEFAGWRERFARAADAVRTPDGELATPELAARAGELLEASLPRLAGESPEGAKRGESARFFAAVFALKGVGLMSGAEEKAIYQRMGFEPGRSRPQRRAPSRELRRVVPGPPQRLNGVRVSAAELWGDRVKLWWHRMISPQERAERKRERIINGPRDRLSAEWRRAAGTFVLTDNLGTPYEAEIYFGSGEQTPWTWLTPFAIGEGEPLPLWGHATFRPAVPKEATQLEAVRGADRFLLTWA